MQKNKTKYDQIIKNIDKLTFDSLLDIMIPESTDGKIPSAKEVEFKKYLIETNPSFLKEIGSKLKTLNKLSKDIYKFNYMWKGRLVVSGLCGTLCISEYTPGLEIIFEDSEIPTFYTKEECVTILKKLLEDQGLLEKYTEKYYQN